MIDVRLNGDILIKGRKITDESAFLGTQQIRSH